MLTEKEKTLLGMGLLEDCCVQDVIDYFGPDMILDKMDDEDIAERVDVGVLRLIDDDTLIDSVSNSDNMLDSIPMGQIEEYLTDKGYKMVDMLESDDVLKKIGEICRELQPNGYIGKEEAKKLLSDYLDFWMVSSF